MRKPRYVPQSPYVSKLILVAQLHERFEFPDELDMTEFLDQSAGKASSEPHLYSLQAIHVLEGQRDGGEYYAYIKPNADLKWFKFHDEVVMHVTEAKVRKTSYGGSGETDSSKQSSAYMLTYVKKTILPDVLGATEPVGVPPHLRKTILCSRFTPHSIKEFPCRTTGRRRESQGGKAQARRGGGETVCFNKGIDPNFGYIAQVLIIVHIAHHRGRFPVASGFQSHEPLRTVLATNEARNVSNKEIGCCFGSSE